MTIFQKNDEENKCLFVLIHGMGGSTNDWLETDGYTKGGNCTSVLNELGYSWLAVDLYGHGDFKAEEKDFDPENVIDDYWPKFIERSVENILREIDLKKQGFSEAAIISYSGGSSVAVKLLEKNTILPVREIHLASPLPDSDNDDEYSMHNNLEVFEKLQVYLYSGEYDEEVDLEEVEWIYDEIECVKKRLNEYNSGHSLPLVWVSDFKINLTER